jgi:hypothetical protein
MQRGKKPQEKPSELAAPQGMDAAMLVVQSIQHHEYGIGMTSDPASEAVQARLRARMQRALEKLTQEIYAEDVHVMFELLQNADDNLYDTAQPALAFVFCSGESPDSPPSYSSLRRALTPTQQL